MPASACRIPAGLRFEPFADGGVERALFFVRRLGYDGRVFLGLRAEIGEQARVAAVVEDHVRRAAVVPLENAVRELPVFLEAFAFVGEDGDARRGDGGGGVVLRREDVARRPAHFGAELDQRLDQHRGLDRHVQRAGDARAFQRLLALVFLAHGHETRHFGLGDGDFLAAETGLRDIGDVIVGLQILGYSAHLSLQQMCERPLCAVPGKLTRASSTRGERRS